MQGQIISRKAFYSFNFIRGTVVNVAIGLIHHFPHKDKTVTNALTSEDHVSLHLSFIYLSH